NLFRFRRRVGGGGGPGGAGPAGAGGEPAPPAVAPERTSPAAWLGARVAALPLPSPRVSALLVLPFVGCGVLLGTVAGSRVDYSLAASAGRQVRLVLPPPASTDPPATESSSA